MTGSHDKLKIMGQKLDDGGFNRGQFCESTESIILQNYSGQIFN